ncbi:pyridoxal phosphate-dependent aminotransferase [Paenibacillus sp. GCM10027626]|uniref:pyridoxal phosphate-dependent aminotransferase n=1 Tax=Paenibacillus sp. GCM10027626 TaxID=3273411 RepID=UPI0036397368
MRGIPSVHRERMRPNSVRKMMIEAAQYPDVIELQIGEPDNATPAFIVEAAKLALDQGFTHYTANAGLPGLRIAVAERMKRKYGLAVSPDRVIVTAGGVSALHIALLALVDAGEEVLIPDPGYPNYEGLVYMQNAAPIYYPAHASHKFLPDIGELEKRVSALTKAIIVNSPNNPTGAVYPEETWKKLLEFAERHHLYVISDEIYDELVYEGKTYCPLAVRQDMSDRIISINGFSKGYAMTGWRLAYMVVPESLVGLMCKLQEPTTTCAAAFTQKAGVAALNAGDGYIADALAKYRSQRDSVCRMLDRYGIRYYRPQGALYVWADIADTGLTSEQFALQLLHTERVIVAPGDGFGPGGSGCIRICFAGNAERLREGLQRIGKFYTHISS